MSGTLFIADLHLGVDTSSENAHFRRLLEQTTLDTLYILGDFFAVWIGNDIQNSVMDEIRQWLNKASQRMKIYLMPGNRDFLLDATFAQTCEITFLPDPTVINLYGTPTLLTHGDVLCIADKSYQRWRRFVQRRWVQRSFLALPRVWRQALAQRIRQRSQQQAANLSASQMAVDLEAMRAMCTQYQVGQMIHGHTHQPLIHYFQHQGAWGKRWVVGDWQWQAQGLIATPQLPLQAITFY